MPCPSDHVPEEQNVVMTDLLLAHPFMASTRFAPKDKSELVAAVAKATRSGRSLRALGSNWSLSRAGVAEAVVDTSALRMFLSHPYPTITTPLAASRIRGNGSSILAQACSRDSSMAGRHYIFVEAGIKLKDLLADLGACELALPTMGDGAGQSLIGALSTATHGADFQVPPLVEWIRAVHLVGPAGQEWWITPRTSVFGASDLIRNLPDWCPDTRVLPDDDAFDAVRVGVGRIGVVYSVILEVVPAYTLIEVNLEHRWHDVRQQLVTSRVADEGLSGIFDAPMSDFDTGWFRAEVLRRTATEGAFNASLAFIPGPPKWPIVPAFFDTNPGVYFDILRDLKVDKLADDLRGAPATKLRHMNLAISLSTTERCWIRRRWTTPAQVRPLALTPGNEDPVVTAVKANKTNPPGVVDAFRKRIALDPITNFFGWLLHDSQQQRFAWYLETEIPRIADEHALQGATSFEALFFMVYRLATDQILDSGEEVARIGSDLIGATFGRVARAGPASGPLLHNMLDAHDYDLDGAQIGDSAEYHFDAAGGDYLVFMDAVVALAGRYFPVFGYMALRFTPAATALIAMQQFRLTASVEVSTPRSRVQDLYAGFWHDVHEAATACRGIPHWGQAFRQPADYIVARYGDKLLKWRNLLAELAADGPGALSTVFSRDKGLEPGEEDDSVELFFAGLQGSVE